MAGPGRQVRWTRKQQLQLAFMVLALSSKEVLCFDDIIPNTLKALKDLPVALQSVVKSALSPVFRVPDAINSRSSTTVVGADDDVPPETFCFGVLGCIANSRDFYDPVLRPINLSPASREEIQVTFKIFSREDPFGVVVPGLDVQQALKSSFNPSRKTKVIIHGFLNGRDMPFLEMIPQVMLYHYDINAVWVDWTEGSIALYNRAVANSRVVGLEVAHFINFLRDNMGLKPEDVHLIGHSLGSHVCGYAGEKIPGLGRITGLDPAEPFFQFLPASVRLDPTDAILVDVIHTDSDSILSIGQGFGLRQPIGHLDFYPNDGRNQPGCEPPLVAPIRWLLRGFNFSKVWHAVEDALGCNHIRATKLFVDSIASQCPYTAFQCHSYKSYKAGECTSCGSDGSGCAMMGFHADSWSGVGTGKTGLFFLSTGNEPKFCRYHYQVSIDMGDFPGDGWSRFGKLYVIFMNQNLTDVAFDLTAGLPKTFETGSQYNFSVEYSKALGFRPEVLVGWNSMREGTSPALNLVISRISVVNMDIVVLDRNRNGRVDGVPAILSFCNDQGRPIVVNNQEVTRVPFSTACTFVS